MKALPPLQHELALKAIAWDCKKRRFVSPSWSDFVWEQLGLATATCYKNEKPYQYQNHEVPDEDCSCGMYCSFKRRVVNSYMGNTVSVLCLVEAYGKTILYHGADAGFISKQMLIRHIINKKDASTIEKMAAFQAAEYFDVTRLDEETALISMDLWNMRLNDDWEAWYQPESDQLNKLTTEELRKVVKQCP